MQKDGLTSKQHQAGYLQSQFLIAMPSLGDPSFKQTVTLICQHNDEGCFGLTINRPIQVTLDELFDQLQIDTHNPLVKGELAMRGGPVQPEQGFVIHDYDDSGKLWENTLKINDSLAVTASRDILLDIANGQGPEHFLLTLGCASWAPGQMETEILANSWLNCPTDNKIIFELPYEKRWQSALDSLGIDINQMSDVAGHA